jgi:hypothetical protein
MAKWHTHVLHLKHNVIHIHRILYNVCTSKDQLIIGVINKNNVSWPSKDCISLVKKKSRNRTMH